MEELRLIAGPARVFPTASAELAGYGPAALKRLVRREAVTLPVFRADLSTVHLTLVGAGHPRRRPHVVVHPRARLPLTPNGRLPAALAVVQTGVACGAVAALIAADAALGRNVVSPGDLTGALDAVRGSPGTASLAAVLSLADGRAQSPGETRLRHALRLLGCATTPQARISAGSRTAYVDLLLDAGPVVVEFDGLVKYGAGGLRPGREELIAEKQREDWLRELGYEVVRVIWAELDNLPALARRIETALCRARSSRPPAALPAALTSHT